MDVQGMEAEQSGSNEQTMQTSGMAAHKVAAFKKCNWDIPTEVCKGDSQRKPYTGGSNFLNFNDDRELNSDIVNHMSPF
ncbi:hypothetical protein Ancab_038979, partial [Ancistrocladus abbreviatus]